VNTSKTMKTIGKVCKFLILAGLVLTGLILVFLAGAIFNENVSKVRTVTQIVEVTRIVQAQAAQAQPVSKPTERASVQAEPTEQPSPIPAQPVIDPATTQDRGAGTWLVGSELALGNWRNSGGDCYAVPYDSKGEPCPPYARGGRNAVIAVLPGTYSVEFVDYPDTCTWHYIGK
jgi:hypothetical protein